MEKNTSKSNIFLSVVLLSFLFINFALNAYASYYTVNSALFSRISGVASGFLYLLICYSFYLHYCLKRFYFDRLSTKILKQIIFIFCYLVINLLFAIVIGNNFSYIAGDFYRAIQPFIILVSLLWIFPVSSKKTYDFIRVCLKVIIILAVLNACIKVGLILFEKQLYGGYLNQYYLGTFLLAYGLLHFFKKGISKNLLYFIGFLTLIVLSILSLKRGVWLSIGITFLFVLLFFVRIKFKNMVLLFFIFASIFLVIWFTPISEPIKQRIDFTFSSGGFDSSTSIRIGEMLGAVYTVWDTNKMAIFTGLGSGAEFKQNPQFPFYSSDTGSKEGYYHHIHNNYTLLFFRYGLIGLILYLLPVFTLVLVFFKNKRKIIKKEDDLHKFVLLSSFVELLVLFFNGITSNSHYGSLFYGLHMYLFIVTINIIFNQKDERSQMNITKIRGESV